MDITVVYDDIKDKDFLELQDFKIPCFLTYINNKKESYKVKSYWGAKKSPFVILKDTDFTKVFYSDIKGDNAIIQLINYLNGSFSKEIKS